MDAVVDHEGVDHVGDAEESALLDQPVLERRRAHLPAYAVVGTVFGGGEVPRVDTVHGRRRRRRLVVGVGAFVRRLHCVAALREAVERHRLGQALLAVRGRRLIHGLLAKLDGAQGHRGRQSLAVAEALAPVVQPVVVAREGEREQAVDLLREGDEVVGVGRAVHAVLLRGRSLQLTLNVARVLAQRVERVLVAIRAALAVIALLVVAREGRHGGHVGARHARL